MQAFEAVVRDHQRRYPLMQPQDYGKLAYQSAFGPEHMVEDEWLAAEFIVSEWRTVEGFEIPCNPEPIGGGLCRFHMTADRFSPENAKALAARFAQSAREHAGSAQDLEERLDILSRLPVDGLQAWLSAWRLQGCPPVHHSEAFRAAYRPHYRVLRQTLANEMLAHWKARLWRVSPRRHEGGKGLRQKIQTVVMKTVSLA